MKVLAEHDLGEELILALGMVNAPAHIVQHLVGANRWRGQFNRQSASLVCDGQALRLALLHGVQDLLGSTLSEFTDIGLSRLRFWQLLRDTANGVCVTQLCQSLMKTPQNCGQSCTGISVHGSFRTRRCSSKSLCARHDLLDDLDEVRAAHWLHPR